MHNKEEVEESGRDRRKRKKYKKKFQFYKKLRIEIEEREIHCPSMYLPIPPTHHSGRIHRLIPLCANLRPRLLSPCKPSPLLPLPAACASRAIFSVQQLLCHARRSTTGSLNRCVSRRRGTFRSASPVSTSA